MKLKFILLALFLGSQSICAEYSPNDELSLADEVLESPTLNINGTIADEKPVQAKPVEKIVLTPKKPLTSAQKMQLYRAKLEERNRMMVQKKIEEIRLRQEIALMRQLEAQMNNTLKTLEKIQ